MPREASFYQDGDRIEYTNETGSNIAVGDVVPMGSMVGVALVNIPDGETGEVKIEGVFEMPAETGTAFAVGDDLYWNATNGELSKTATSNTAAGKAIFAKASATATAYVKIG